MNEYSQMVSDLAKSGEDIIKTLNPLSAHTLHMAIGLAGEAGELLEHYIAGSDSIYSNVPDSSILEELGDSEFYLEGLCQSMGIGLPLSEQTSTDPLSIPRFVVSASNMLDLVKKVIIYNKEVDLMAFVNHVIDVRIHLDKVYSYYDLTASQAQDHNMHKLLKGDTARYKKGSYSDQAAQERADKT